MNRFTSAMLATALVVASGSAMLAAPTPAPANPTAQAGTNPAAIQQKAERAARRDDRADRQETRMTHALNLLEANGYGAFSDFKRDGDDFAATVSQSGTPFTVIVNPDTDQITRRS